MSVKEQGRENKVQSGNFIYMARFIKLNVINTENKNRKTCRFDYVLSQWKHKKKKRHSHTATKCEQKGFESIFEVHFMINEIPLHNFLQSI